MATVTVQLTAEIEQQLRLQAAQRGLTLEAYLSDLAAKEAAVNDASDMLSKGRDWLTQRGADEVRAARARLLDISSPLRTVPAGKTILDMVEGKWPGTETDAEVRDALDRIS